MISYNLNLEKHSVTLRNYAVTYYQNLEKVPWLFRLQKPKNDNKLQNLKKNASLILKNYLKFDIKKLKTTPCPINKFQKIIIKHLKRFSGSWVWKNLNSEKQM